MKQQAIKVDPKQVVPGEFKDEDTPLKDIIDRRNGKKVVQRKKIILSLKESEQVVDAEDHTMKPFTAGDFKELCLWIHMAVDNEVDKQIIMLA